MEDKPRTLKQNSSLHKFCEILADELNSAGYDVSKTLKQDVEVPWTMILIKELIFKKIMTAMYGYKSTTELKTGEVSKVAEVIIRHVGEKFGIPLDWPSIESLLNNQLGEKK